MLPAACPERRRPGKRLWKALEHNDTYSKINFQKLHESLNSSPSKSAEDESKQPLQGVTQGCEHNGQDPGNPGGPWATTEALI